MSIQKESYLAWLKTIAGTVFPRVSDWGGAGWLTAELVVALWRGITLTITRLLILVTFPISVPALALMARRVNHKAAEREAKQRADLIASLASLQPKEASNAG